MTTYRTTPPQVRQVQQKTRDIPNFLNPFPVAVVPRLRLSTGCQQIALPRTLFTRFRFNSNYQMSSSCLRPKHIQRPSKRTIEILLKPRSSEKQPRTVDTASCFIRSPVVAGPFQMAEIHTHGKHTRQLKAVTGIAVDSVSWYPLPLHRPWNITSRANLISLYLVLYKAETFRWLLLPPTSHTHTMSGKRNTAESNLPHICPKRELPWRTSNPSKNS